MKVLVYPRDGNPYQDLLYGPMRDTHRVQIEYLRRYGVLNIILLPAALIMFRLRRFRVFHIHWPAFVVTTPFIGGPRASYIFYRGVVWLASCLGFQLVWTVHNVVPHQQETADDVAAAKFLAAHCRAKIAHSPNTVDDMTRNGLDTTGVRVIPHGTYDGIYPPGVGRARMRSELGVADAEVLFIAFGLIRPYKGIPALINAFDQLDRPDSKLLIAGVVSDPGVIDALAAAQNPNIIVKGAHVPDADVSDYFAAADCACYPMLRITTSGSTLLAITFGTPILASRLGDLAQLPPDLGFFYEPDDEDGLKSALQRALDARDHYEDFRRATKEYAKTISWDRISDETYALYTELLHRNYPPTRLERSRTAALDICFHLFAIICRNLNALKGV